MEGKVREVVPGVFLVHLPLPMKPSIVNVFLLDGGDEWALVDTGMNSGDSIAAFRAALETVGCRPEQIRKIICTHHHPDHFGTSKAYKALTGATLYLHRAEYERSQAFLPTDRAAAVQFFLRHGIPLQRFANVPRPADIWGGLYETTPPDAHLEDGDVLVVGRHEVHVVWTPGHAPGHCVLHLRRPRVMIAGDHLLPKITPHVGVGPGAPGNPLKDFLASQRKVQALDIDLVLPAHGGPFADHRHRASQIIQHHRVRLQDMLDIVRRHQHAAYDIARRAFAFDTDSPLSYQFPATFETLAHLEYLREAGDVTSLERDDVVYWQAA